MVRRSFFQQIMAISRKRQYQLLTEHGIEDDEKLEMVDALPLKDVRVVFQVWKVHTVMLQ